MNIAVTYIQSLRLINPNVFHNTQLLSDAPLSVKAIAKLIIIRPDCQVFAMDKQLSLYSKSIIKGENSIIG